MKNLIIFTTLLLSLLLSSCVNHTSVLSTTQHHTNSLSLAGQWQFSPEQSVSEETQWQSIQVPANWYKQGFDISGKAHYKKQFFVDKNAQKKRITLLFKGVDYYTKVWLNNRYVGFHEGYFQNFSFDISPFIKWGQKNELRVQVDSPLEKNKDYSLNKRLIKGIFAHHDTRPGGAWSKQGQDRNTGGIWDTVELHMSEHVFAQQIKAIPKKIHANQWQLITDISLTGKLPDNAEFHWQLTPKNHTAKTFSGISKQAQFAIDVTSPQLWWPIGFGKANLYELNVRIQAQDKTLHQIKTTTAFRHIELSKNKVWKINGQRLILRGTNYIATQWLSEMSKAKFAQDIALMKAANINAIRVHAHITAPDFYALCDEAGLMIWQDFPLQWGYQDSTEFHQQAQLQLSDMMGQLANHPSIIHWTLHNEPPWDADWMKWKYPDYDANQNKQLDATLYKLAQRWDRSRPVSMYSATKEHPWLGWYSGHWLDYAKATDQAFIAEFGAQALPKKSSLKKILQGDIALPEVSEAERKREWKSWKKWQYHNFQPRETFEIAKIKAGKNTNELIANTQKYQAQLTQLAAESYRRQSYQPVTALFQFMFVEDWESMNWGVVDYWRNTKPAYQSLKMAYQAILPSLEWSQIEYPEGQVSIGLWVLNDTPHNYETIHYKVQLTQDNTVLDQKQYSIDFLADTHQKIKQYQTPSLTVGKYQVFAQLVNQDGKVLGHNKYHFTVK